MAEDLVPTAGDGLIRQAHQPLQHVSDWRRPRHLPGSGHVERPRAVVE
jgi:hypothetical protein